MKARSLISVAAAIFATTCAYGRFVYTETGNLSGSLSDGIWVLNATRVNGTNNLNVNGSQGNFLGSEPSPLNLTEIYSEDGETQYYAVTFETLSHSNKSSKSTLYVYKDMVTEFIAPDCTETRGSGCFQDCTALTNVQLNANVTALGGDRPFMGCVNLVSFYPTNLNVTSMRIQTFSGCSKLEGFFRLPNWSTFGGGGQQFTGCAKITGIYAPLITYIEGNTFNGCSSLETAQFASDITRIGNYAFSNCAALSGDDIRTMLASRSLERIGSADAANLKGVFSGCTSLSGAIDWNQPNLTTNVVGSEMFKNCTALSRVNFITDIAEIRTEAFAEIAEGAELYMPLAAPVVFGTGAIARKTPPYPKVYLKGNFEDWLTVMGTQNHIILKEQFNDTTWSHTYGVDTKNWSTISGKMAADSAMCTKSGNTITVHDKNIIAFVMRGNNTGCWVLEESESKRGTIIIVK